MSKQALLHITSLAEREAAQTVGEYQPQGFSQENFIHCSYSHQILTVANLDSSQSFLSRTRRTRYIID